MRYKVEDIEDQIIATLAADVDNLSGVTIDTHAGTLNPRSFLNAELLEGILPVLPLIYIQYQGSTPVLSNSTKFTNVMEIRFRLYIGAQSLRTQKEAQRDCYRMLRAVYDDLHGKVPLSNSPSLTELPFLGGTPIDATTTGFNPQSPLMKKEGRGTDEILMVTLPQIKVYNTDYAIRLLA